MTKNAVILLTGAALIAAVGFAGWRNSRGHEVASPALHPPAAQESSPSAEPTPPELPTLSLLPASTPPAALDLPSGAPKSVTFGAILFEYRGAQLASARAPAKDVAYAKAKTAVSEAMTDFNKAAKLGDPGSTADAGVMPRGVLEPALEYALFTLSEQTVHPEPIDTPRGFWVVKRLR